MRLLKFSLIPILFLFPLFAESTSPITEEQPLLVENSSDKKKEASSSKDKKDQKNTPQKPSHDKDKNTPEADKESHNEKDLAPQPVDSEHLTAATESYEGAFFKTILVLVGLLILVVLTIWMFKKISNGRFRNFNYLKAIKVIEKRPLSPKSMLYLVEVAGKQILISESQLEVRTLSTLDYLGEKDL